MLAESRHRWLLTLPIAGAVLAASLAMAPAASAAKDDPKAWGALYDEGTAALRAKEFRKAEEKLLAALELLKEVDSSDARHKRTLEGLVDLWMTEREWAAAANWLEKIVALDEHAHGPESLDVAFSLARLAHNQVMMRKFDEAEASYKRALAIRIKVAGPDDPGVAKLQNNLGETYRRANQLEKAEQMYLEAIAQKEELHGKDHPSLATSLNDLAVVRNQLKKFAEAKPILTRAAKIAETLGPESPVLGRILHNLADAHAGLNEHERAEQLYLRALAIAEAQKPKDRPGMGSTLNNLANLYQYMKRYEDALKSYERAIEVRKLEYGSRHRSVKQARMNMAVVLDRLGRAGEAEAIRAEYKKK